MNVIETASEDRNPAEGMAGNPFVLEASAPAKRRENHELALLVGELATRRRWTMTECATRAEMAVPTFSAWRVGKYTGDVKEQNRRVRNWLAAVEEEERLATGMPQSPSFVRTRFSAMAMEMFRSAQMMPELVMITAEAGIGKTVAARRFKAVGQNVYLVTMSPHNRSLHAMLSEIAEEIDCYQQSSVKLVRSLAKRMARRGAGTLLIVDEAQNLTDEGINQLRYFLDNHGTGIALLGNSETYGRFTGWNEKKHFAQLRSRVFRRQLVMVPDVADVEALADAWGVSDPRMRTYLMAIARKPGALRNIDKTLKLAKLTANGLGEELSLSHLKKAWSARDIGDAGDAA